MNTKLAIILAISGVALTISACTYDAVKNGSFKQTNNTLSVKAEGENNYNYVFTFKEDIKETLMNLNTSEYKTYPITFYIYTDFINFYDPTQHVWTTWNNINIENTEWVGSQQYLISSTRQAILNEETHIHAIYLLDEYYNYEDTYYNVDHTTHNTNYNNWMFKNLYLNSLPNNDTINLLNNFGEFKENITPSITINQNTLNINIANPSNYTFYIYKDYINNLNNQAYAITDNTTYTLSQTGNYIIQAKNKTNNLNTYFSNELKYFSDADAAAKIDDLTKINNDLTTQINELNNQINNVQNQNNNLTTQVNNLNATITQQENTINNLLLQLNAAEYGSEVVDIPGLMLDILAMPWAFLSTAFDLTIFENTPYEINFSNIFKGLIAILTLLFIVKLFTSGFSVVDNYNKNTKSNKNSNKPKSVNINKPKDDTE